MTLATRFHRDEQAQISFLALAAAICFIALLAMVINTNDVIEDRVHMQDVADATVLSAASWSARGLNLVSFINVLNTKLLSTAVLLNALNDALPVIIKVAQIQQKIFTGCTGVPFIGAFCAVMAAVVQAQIAILQPVQSVIKSAVKTLSKCPSGALWKIMKTLETGADAIRKTFVGIAVAESMSIARANGATNGLVINGRLISGNPQDGLFLPVEKGKFDEFCPKMKFGGSGYKLQGYKCGEGPLTVGKDNIKTMLLPFINLGAGPIFGAMVTKNMNQLGCTPGPGDNTPITVQLSDLAECKKYKSEAIWSHMVSFTRPVTDGSWTYKDFVPWQPKGAGTGKKTDKADDLLEGLKGLPGAGDTSVEETSPDFKEGYEAIDADSESVRSDATISCSGSGYPKFSPGIDTIMSSCQLGLPCQDMRSVEDFHWISSGQKEGPENGVTGGYFIRVRKPVELEPETEGGPKRYVYTVDTVVLSSSGEKEMTLKEYEKYMQDKGAELESQGNTKNCKPPVPWLLKKDTGYQDSLRYIGVVYKDTSKDLPFWSTFFANPPTTIAAYAQAEVYNHLEEDTFTQDWRVRLERATLLESFLQKKKPSGMNNSNFAGDFIGTVNNH